MPSAVKKAWARKGWLLVKENDRVVLVMRCPLTYYRGKMEECWREKCGWYHRGHKICIVVVGVGLLNRLGELASIGVKGERGN